MKVKLLLLMFFLFSCVGTLEDNDKTDKSTVNEPKQDFLFAGADSGLWVSNTRLSVRFLPATGGSGTFRYQLLDEGGNVLTAESGSSLEEDSNGMLHLTHPGFPSGTNHRVLVRAIDTERNIPDTNDVYVTINLPADQYPEFNGVKSCGAFPGAGGQNQLNVNWDKGGIFPNGLFGNLPHSVGSYRVYYCKKSDGTSCLEEDSPKRGITTVLSGTQEQVTISGLEANTDYYIRVTAVSQGEQGSPETQREERNIEFTSCKTEVASGPIVFDGITSVELEEGDKGINEVKVTWAQASGGYTGYILYYHPVVDENSVFNYLDPNIQKLTILDPLKQEQALIGLDSFTNHAFLVRACADLVADPTCNDGNDASEKFIIKETKPNVAVFAGIKDATNDVLNPSNIYLNFDPADTSTGGIFDEYRVIISDGSNEYDITQSNSTNKLGAIYPGAPLNYQDLYLDNFSPTNITSTFAKLNGLKPGVIYQADVQAWVNRTAPLPISGGSITAAYGTTNTTPLAVSNDDTTPPLVSGMTVTPLNGILTENDTVTFVVTYNEALLISGNPRIGINLGGITKYADMTANTSTTMTFMYTVVNGDNDLDGLAFDTNAISLNGATISDLSGNNANLNFIGYAPDISLIKVDTTPPNPPINITFTKPWLSGADPIQVAAWVNPPSDFAYAEVGVASDGNGVPNAVAFTQASSTSSHTFPNISGSLSECNTEYRVMVRSVDAAGLMSTIGQSANTFKYDGTAPSVSVVTLQGTTSDIFVANNVNWTPSTDTCSLSHYEIAIGKDDDSDGFGSDDVNNVLDWSEVPGGTAVTSYQARSGIDGMTFSLNATEDFYVSIRAVDDAGNHSVPGSSASFQVDIAGPDTPANLAIASQWISGTLPLNSPQVTWTNPGDADFQHIKIALGTAIGQDDVVGDQNIGTFTTYTWNALNSIAECQKYYPRVVAYDNIGNPSVAASSPLVWFQYDNTAPTLSGGDIDMSAGGASLLDNEAPLANWASVTSADNCNAVSKYEIAIGFDNDSDGFDAGDAENLVAFREVPGGSTTNQYQVQSGTDGFNFTMAAGFDYYISIRAVDEVGNVSNIFTASTPYNFPVDNTAPEVAITTAATNPVTTNTFTVTMTFTENVTGFAQSDLQVTNGSVTSFSGGPTIYTADIEASAYGTVAINIPLGAAQDAASNPSVAAPEFTILHSSNEPMVSIWKTTAANEVITLPFYGGGYTYDMLVNWGDGNTTAVRGYSDPNKSHTYVTPGTYTITIYGVLESWRFGNGGHKNKLYSVTDLGDVGWRSLNGAFYGCQNLSSVSGGKTGNVTNMREMFRGTPLAVPDTSSYDTSKVTDMYAMFYQAPNANPNTTNWDVSKVTSMQSMFGNATIANPDTSNWDTSSLTTVYGMFSNAVNANPDVSGWDTSKVTNMGYMFFRARKAVPVTTTNGNIWNTGAVTSMYRMFYEADIANPDTSGWDTSKVTNMREMFYNAVEAQPVTTTNGNVWNTGLVTDMQSMFNRARKANPDTSGWDTSKVTSMAYMFHYADVAQPTTTNWNTATVNNMYAMFNNAPLANPDTSNWNTGNVTNMATMFYNAPAANPDTSGWDTSKVTRMDNMFYNASSANPDTSGWDTSKVTRMDGMFYRATNASPTTTTSGNIWNTSNVTNMIRMFRQAPNANPDTSGWDTSKVTSMQEMFYVATSANPDTSGWNTSNVTTMYSMFNRATTANPNVSGWDTSKVKDMRYIFYRANAANPDMQSWNFVALERINAPFYQAYAFSNTNYSNFLNRINATVGGSIIEKRLNSTSARYQAGAAAARAALIGDGWTVTDGGPE